MKWAILLLLLSAVYGIGISYYLIKKNNRLKFTALFLASLTFFAVALSNLLDTVTAGKMAEFITAQVSEWGYVYTIVLVLGGLLLFIRESKPEFSRFPLFYAALPAVLIISYLLVYNTPVLKKWVLSVAEAGAAITAIIMYGMYTYYKRIYSTLLAGSILFLITFIAHLVTMNAYPLVWQILLFISTVTVFTGYLLVDRHYSKD